VTPTTRVHCVFHALTLAAPEAVGASRSGGPAATCGVPRSRESRAQMAGLAEMADFAYKKVGSVFVAIPPLGDVL
jgi:hypothetical protein